jgi:hypothetical protein
MDRLPAEVPHDLQPSPEFLRRLSRFLVGVRDAVEQVFRKPVWIELTNTNLLNGWQVNNADGTSKPGYYKDHAGRVWLKGLVKNAAPTPFAAIFNLPSGYRPVEDFNFPNTDLNAGGALQSFVSPDGNVKQSSGTANIVVALNHMSFAPAG